MSLISDDQNHYWWCCLPRGGWETSAGWRGNSLILSKEILKSASAVPTPRQIPLLSWEHTRHLQQSSYFYFFCRTSQKFKHNPSTSRYLISATYIYSWAEKNQFLHTSIPVNTHWLPSGTTVTSLLWLPPQHGQQLRYSPLKHKGLPGLDDMGKRALSSTAGL